MHSCCLPLLMSACQLQHSIHSIPRPFMDAQTCNQADRSVRLQSTAPPASSYPWTETIRTGLSRLITLRAHHLSTCGRSFLSMLPTLVAMVSLRLMPASIWHMSRSCSFISSASLCSACLRSCSACATAEVESGPASRAARISLSICSFLSHSWTCNRAMHALELIAGDRLMVSMLSCSTQLGQPCICRYVQMYGSPAQQ